MTAAIMITVIATATVCAAFHSWDIRRRNKQLHQMTEEIDRLLHEDRSKERTMLSRKLEISGYEEGEMSLLANEIGKMTARLEEQTERLASDKQYLADSIADISHQIRTPLTSMYLQLEAVRESIGDESKQRRHLRELRKLQEQIDWLITALLKLAKLDAGRIIMNPEPIKWQELIQKSAEPLAILMELRGQELNIDAEGNVFADGFWTQEALRNVLKNCTEHMEEGKIYIHAGENPLYSEITIRDNGSGFDPEDLPHIFERFYKGKNASKQSVGIGLALARMIIVRQNGTICAKNHPDGGAVFEIRFYKNVGK